VARVTHKEEKSMEKSALDQALEILYSVNGLNEDVVQDAALRLCRTIKDYDPEKGSINTWVWWAVKKVRYTDNRRMARALAYETSLEAASENGWEPAVEDLGMRSMEFLDSLKDLSPGAKWIAELALRNGVSTKGEIASKCIKLKKAGRRKPVAWTHARVKAAFDEIKEILK